MPAQSRQLDNVSLTLYGGVSTNGTMTDEQLNAAITEAQRRRYDAIKAPFEGYNHGDMIKFTYAGGSNPGQVRTAKFHSFVDLKHGPGMQAIHSNKPKKYYLKDMIEHQLADAHEPASDVEDNSPEPSEASDEEATIEEGSQEESSESEPDLDGQLTYANQTRDEIVALRQQYQVDRQQAVDEFMTKYDRMHLPRLNRTIERKRKYALTTIQAVMYQLQDA
jgi:hypothetical protein